MSEMDIDEIMKTIPHRYPMLLVDRIIECDDTKRIVGIKNVTATEPFFQGHFPGLPIMPGVLQIEAMAQTGGILLMKMGGKSGGTTYLMAVDKVRFRKAVRPGDVMRIEVEIINMRSNAAKYHGRVLVDGEVASEAEIMCMVKDKEPSS